MNNFYKLFQQQWKHTKTKPAIFVPESKRKQWAKDLTKMTEEEKKFHWEKKQQRSDLKVQLKKWVRKKDKVFIARK